MKKCYFDSLVAGRTKITHSYWNRIKNEGASDILASKNEEDSAILTTKQQQQLCQVYKLKRYLSVPETAIYLNCSPKTIYRLINNNKIKSFRLHDSKKSSIFIDVDQFEEIENEEK